MWDTSTLSGKLAHDQAYAKEKVRIENWLRKGNEERYAKLQAERQQTIDSDKDNLLKQLRAIQGMADSSKNQPMPVESKKGKLDSVGRIDEDVNLNTDSIQMMKAIAERQWIVQNEVMVPQKVEMNVDKSTNMDPNSIAEVLNTGMQLAIASSMRGEAVA